VSHAHVKKVFERPLLGRYLFVEVDCPRQSFDDVAGAQGVESIISLMGVPCVMPRGDVEELLSRYLAGEFDQAKQFQSAHAFASSKASLITGWRQ
jgi:transcription antitermination factor NusG